MSFQGSTEQTQVWRKPRLLTADCSKPWWQRQETLGHAVTTF